jgi:FAD/FMN-containing dehydrogenase
MTKAPFANRKTPPTTAAGKLLSRLAGLAKARQEPLTEAEAARLTGADLHELMHQALFERETVTDEQLLALAQARGEAIRSKAAPRRAAGPDLMQAFVAGEGAFGVITAAHLRVHRPPKTRQLVAAWFPGPAAAPGGAAGPGGPAPLHGAG